MTTPMPAPLILAVDDSPDDLSLLEMAMKAAAPGILLKTVESGEQAIDYVLGRDKYADRNAYPLPRLIILDLKMPRVTGFDVLRTFQEMKLGQPPFIVVMSASNLSIDQEKAMELGATAFHVKPVVFPDFCALVSKVTTFFCAQNI